MRNGRNRRAAEKIFFLVETNGIERKRGPQIVQIEADGVERSGWLNKPEQRDARRGEKNNYAEFG
jgi:hypothetical protein